MLIIGCDYHPGFQQIAFVETETGECGERRLTHREEAEQFYSALKGQSVRVGMEASGHARWFERLLMGLQFELWIGDAAEIRTKRVRKQKTDRQDAQLLLRLMIEDRFPRIWVADAENRDLRQLLWLPPFLFPPPAGGSQQRTGVIGACSVGRPTTPGFARRTRPTHSEGPGTDPSFGRGSGEATGDAATDDPFRRGPTDGLSVRVSDWNTRTLSLRQADCQLCRTGSVGRVQRRSPPTRAHQQTGQLAAALLAGGSGPGHGAQSTAVAQQVLSPRHAARQEDRQSSDGSKAGGTSVLDVASGSGLRSVPKARFARGRARKSPWCAVNHRRNDWVSRSPAEGEFEVVIMIAVVIEEMDGSD